MPKKDKQNKEPSEADPRASWEEAVQESEDDKSSKDDKSGDSTQVFTMLQAQFQAQLVEMQENFNKQVLAMQATFDKQLAVVTARQESQAKLQVSQAEAGPHPPKTKNDYRQPEFAMFDVSAKQKDGLTVALVTHFENCARKLDAYNTHESFDEDAQIFPPNKRLADLLLGTFTMEFQTEWMQKSKIPTRDQARSMSYHKLKGSLLDFAIKKEFGHNLADYFRKNPQYPTQSVASIKARMHYLLEALPDQLSQMDVRQAAFEMFTPDIQRVMIYNNPDLAEYEFPSVPELFTAAAAAEKLVQAEVRIASQTRKSWAAPPPEPPVLMVTANSNPDPRPVPQARIEPVEDDDAGPCPDLNALLIRGLPNGTIERPNPVGQVLLTLAMPNPAQALEPDLRIPSSIPMAQQQAVVFAVAADLAQQPCLDNKVQLSEVLNYLRLVIEQATKDAPAFRKQLQRLAANRSAAWQADVRSPVKCWNCGEEGHRQRDCPKPLTRNPTDYSP